MKSSFRIRARAFLGLCLLASALPAAAQRADVPYYRVFRGVRLAAIPQSQFVATMNSVFIPALPLTHAKNGAVAYLPALPPPGKPASVQDEYALIGYESEEVYRAASATQEGRQYGDLHWTLFDREKSKRSGAVPWGGQAAPDVSYDVLGRPVDWQSGHATFFIGLRNPNLNPEQFRARLERHVEAVRKAFSAHGLDGYVFVSDNDTEAAFQHWPSPEAAQAAFDSAEGKEIIADAQQVLVPAQWSVAKAYDGNLQPDQVANVLFKRRSSAP